MSTRPAKLAESEKGFQRAVFDLARAVGWRVAHFRPARTKWGWCTPVAADGAGFPDAIMVRRSSIIAVEFKSERGVVSKEQRAWLEAFEAAGVPAYVWRPSDFDQAKHVLMGGRGDLTCDT